MAPVKEVGVGYEVVDVNFATLEHKGPEHLARNPFGQIPGFQDDELMLFGEFPVFVAVDSNSNNGLIEQ
ncbi:putative glutathione S-transferase GSTF1 [Panicum miliaceum]|uniref:Glutathione S-transferase GSTF1 n=1 Tax=Panicum miliaceum TaxID=4540 RepID=A0A3L6QYQ8_PANMI|nr:putative glutathione S-transferase GSTF1 [Panicum miliaceum]